MGNKLLKGENRICCRFFFWKINYGKGKTKYDNGKIKLCKKMGW